MANPCTPPNRDTRMLFPTCTAITVIDVYFARLLIPCVREEDTWSRMLESFTTIAS